LEIKYLKHNQIDKRKWDSAIENAQNGLVYALSWYLNSVSPKWGALVVGDYDVVMPLTHKRKYGISYLYQPIFIQQLGIFSKDKVSSEQIESFINLISNNYKFIEIYLNTANPRLNNDFFKLRNTQLIHISKSYEELYLKYAKSLKLNLHKVSESGLIIQKKGNSFDFIKLMQNMFEIKHIREIRKIDFKNLKNIIDFSINNNLGQFYFGYLNDELCAAAFFLKWGNRVILYTALNEKGREVSAMFGLIDRYIQENAGQDLIFDFAGSNIPGVKYRNLGFGATNETYFAFKLNNLPIPFKWFKR